MTDRERLEARGWSRRWFVEVRIPRALVVEIYAIGPCGSWSRARELAELWEAELGANTTRLHTTMTCGKFNAVPGSGFIPAGVVPGACTSATGGRSRPAAARR